MRNLQKIYGVIAASFLPLLAALVATSCSGGSTTATPDTTAGYLSGTIAITGAPLADLTDPTAVGTLDADKWSAWLIDTTEDVDNIEIGTGDNVLQATTVPDPGVYILEIELLPAADLTGGVSLTTPVTISLPITVALNATTTADISVEFIPDVATSSLHNVSQAGGYRVHLSYDITGPDPQSELIELHWLNRTLRSDSNRDGLFTDEPEYFDSDRDCLSDAQWERIRQGPSQPQPETAKGTISHISMMMRNLRIGNDVFRIDEMTKVMRNGQRVHPLELAVGDQIRITYVEGMNRMQYALGIEILD